jgi:nucleoside-diphosphate-sugar epimerase
MRAFVTGATGLLGNNLVRTLLAEGHSVRAASLSVDSTKARRELGASFRPFEDTVRDAVAWFRASQTPTRAAA